jgi:hypothetical protein
LPPLPEELPPLPEVLPPLPDLPPLPELEPPEPVLPSSADVQEATPTASNIDRSNFVFMFPQGGKRVVRNEAGCADLYTT